ncbi:MAG: hypothetical protein ACFFD4_04595 [Candidatus Odinarchaeota archaeon]
MPVLLATSNLSSMSCHAVKNQSRFPFPVTTVVMDAFSLLAGISLLFFLSVNSGLSFKLLLDYLDLSSLRLLIVMLLINSWVLSGILVIFDPVLSGATNGFLPVLFSAGLICFFTGLAGLSRVLNQAFHGTFLRVLVNSSGTCYSIAAVLAAADVFLERPMFFTLSPLNGELDLFMHPFSLAVTLLAVILITVSVAGSILIPNPVRNYFYTHQVRFKSVLLIAFAGFLLAIPAAFCGTVIFHAIPFKTGRAINMLSVSGLFFTIYYLSATQPLFLLLSGANSGSFLERGYTGYFFGAFMDEGPVPATVSAAFKERMGLSDQVLLHLALKVLMVAGTDSSARSHREAAVIHVPVTDDINALGVFFNSTNPVAKDPRLQRCTPVVFGILFPAVLNGAFQHIFSMLPLVLEQVSRKTVPELDDHEFLEKLARTVLRRLLG